MRRTFVITFGAAALAAAAASASSHREAPGISLDPVADNTDLYAFISPDAPDTVTVVANYVPLLKPASGPNFWRFGDAVLYEIKVDNDGDADADLAYQFRFKTTVLDGNTFLYNKNEVASPTDGNLNVQQKYAVTRVDYDTGEVRELGGDLPTAPWNVGKRSFPSGYDAVAAQAVASLTGGYKVFAGPRDDPFFVDLRVFDLVGVGGAVDEVAGSNVMTIALQIPITDLAKGGARPADATLPEAVIGFYATASRPRVRVLRSGRDPDAHGQYVQVSRLGWPLVNEVLIPLGDKDKFNRSEPKDDVANFGAYLLAPEIVGLLNTVLQLGCPKAGVSRADDLVPLLGANGTTPADLLRLNIAQGQTADASHFPNGRALADDVVATELTVLCYGNPPAGGPLDDGVTENDKPMLAEFPYVPGPHSGNPE